jgi:hypothetical protein
MCWASKLYFFVSDENVALGLKYAFETDKKGMPNKGTYLYRLVVGYI